MAEKLWELAVNFFQIGSFSIGGGYAIIALIEELLVNRYHWLSLKEYTDIITISQMTPGPLAINASSFTGLKISGPLGAVAVSYTHLRAHIQLHYYRFRHLFVLLRFFLLSSQLCRDYVCFAGTESCCYRADRCCRCRDFAAGAYRS